MLVTAGDVWPGGGGRGTAEAIWRGGNCSALAQEEKLILWGDYNRNESGEYGLPPPTTGWAAAGFAEQDIRPCAAAMELIMGEVRRSSREISGNRLAGGKNNQRPGDAVAVGEVPAQDGGGGGRAGSQSRHSKAG